MRQSIRSVVLARLCVNHQATHRRCQTSCSAESALSSLIRCQTTKHTPLVIMIFLIYDYIQTLRSHRAGRTDRSCRLICVWCACIFREEYLRREPPARGIVSPLHEISVSIADSGINLFGTKKHIASSLITTPACVVARSFTRRISTR